MKIDIEEDFDRCPFCKGMKDEHGMEKGMLIIIRDWTSRHCRETLLHCWDCDRKFLIYYKFDRIVELKEEEMEPWWNGKN